MHLNVVRQRTKRKVICNILYFAASASITNYTHNMYFSFLVFSVLLLAMHVYIGRRFAVISLIRTRILKMCGFNYHNSFFIMMLAGIRLSKIFLSLHCHCWYFDCCCCIRFIFGYNTCVYSPYNYWWNETTILNYGTLLK